MDAIQETNVDEEEGRVGGEDETESNTRMGAAEGREDPTQGWCFEQ